MIGVLSRRRRCRASAHPNSRSVPERDGGDYRMRTVCGLTIQHPGPHLCAFAYHDRSCDVACRRRGGRGPGRRGNRGVSRQREGPSDVDPGCRDRYVHLRRRHVGVQRPLVANARRRRPPGAYAVGPGSTERLDPRLTATNSHRRSTAMHAAHSCGRAALGSRDGAPAMVLAEARMNIGTTRRTRVQASQLAETSVLV